MTRRYSGLGQATCAVQQQELGAAQAAQAQAAAQASFDGGLALNAANQRLQAASQAFQSCQQGGSSVSDTLKTAAPIVGSLVSMGAGIASMFIKPATPAMPVAYQQPIAQPQNNNTVIIAVVAGVFLLLVVVLMMGKK